MDASIDDTTKIAKPILTPALEKWQDDQLNVAWLGHASFLINFFGTRILIDPAFYERIGNYSSRPL